MVSQNFFPPSVFPNISDHLLPYSAVAEYQPHPMNPTSLVLSLPFSAPFPPPFQNLLFPAIDPLFFFCGGGGGDGMSKTPPIFLACWVPIIPTISPRYAVSPFFLFSDPFARDANLRGRMPRHNHRRSVAASCIFSFHPVRIILPPLVNGIEGRRTPAPITHSSLSCNRSLFFFAIVPQGKNNPAVDHFRNPRTFFSLSSFVIYGRPFWHSEIPLTAVFR